MRACSDLGLEHCEENEEKKEKISCQEAIIPKVHIKSDPAPFSYLPSIRIGD